VQHAEINLFNIFSQLLFVLRHKC